MVKELNNLLTFFFFLSMSSALVLPGTVVIILASLGKYGKQTIYTDGGKEVYMWVSLM